MNYVLGVLCVFVGSHCLSFGVLGQFRRRATDVGVVAEPWSTSASGGLKCSDNTEVYKVDRIRTMSSQRYRLRISNLQSPLAVSQSRPHPGGVKVETMWRRVSAECV